MTREELREHCERQIQQFERVEKIMPVTLNDWKRYEEHKLILELLEQEPKWIPVSERLPEEREWLGTKRFGTTKSDEVYVTLETSDGERFTKHLAFQNGGLSEVDQETMRVWFKEAVPIAWMSEPKPYRGEK